MILGPVSEQLSSKRLLVIADGALQYIPFGALPGPTMKARSAYGQGQPGSTADTPTQTPLIESHEIVSLPSASTLAVLQREVSGRNPASRTVAVFADPVFDKDDPRVQNSDGGHTGGNTEETITEVLHRALRDANVCAGNQSIPRLLASREEADAILSATSPRQIFRATDFDASRLTVTSADLSQYRVIHFATHGILDTERPELSGIVLSLVDRNGQAQNGFLRLHDIYNLNLPVDLVVLSACNTGLGREVKGEGLIGLTRGFMYAGAAGIVASLWKVDDEATAQLMKQFYKAMFNDRLPPSAALRQAQLAMWKQKRWHAPYYWAAFVFQGKYRSDEGSNRQVVAGSIKAAGFEAAIAGIAFLALSLLLWRPRNSL
jgi:CHAT domain-containing protein